MDQMGASVALGPRVKPLIDAVYLHCENWSD
jgi:hypothetical protein